MQPGTVEGAAYEFHAARARMGTRPGVNSPLTTSAFDTSGNGNHGTLTSFAGTTASGYAGTGTLADPHRLVFDGASDYVLANPIAGLDSHAASVEAWVRYTVSADVADGVVCCGDATGLLQWNPGKISAVSWSSTWGDMRAVESPATADGDPHHLVMTLGAQYMTLYCDGQYVGEADILTGFTMPALTYADLGSRAGAGSYWGGAIMAARIYPFALTPAQVAQNYAAGYLWTPPQVRAPLLHQRPPVTIEAAGLLSRAKRRQDYCHVWSDFDAGQWYTPEGDWTPGIQAENAGYLKFAAASGSVFPAASWQTFDYWLHKGLSVEDAIYRLDFEYTSLGAMELLVYETELPDDAASWTLLDTLAGATQASPAAVTLNCSANMRGLRIKVGYTLTHTLSGANEWLRIGNLVVYGQDGTATMGMALADILVATGLADSYESETVA